MPLYQWETEPILDRKHGWVFMEARAPGDRSGRQLKKKALRQWELDENGSPLPDLNPNLDDSGGQNDSTPRASSATLVPGMHNLNIHQDRTESNSSEYLSLDDHSSPKSPQNYHYSPQDQGTSYGGGGQIYGPPDTMPQPSRKGKDRTQYGSQHGGAGRSSARHSSNQSHRGTYKKPSSSRDSNIDLARPSQLQEQAFPLANSVDGTAMAYSTGNYETSGYQTQSSYFPSSQDLYAVSETATTSTHNGANAEALTEVNGYDNLSNGLEPISASGAYVYSSQPSSSRSTRPSLQHNPTDNWDTKALIIHHAKDFREGTVLKMMDFVPAGGPIPTGVNGSVATQYSAARPSRISDLPEDKWGYRSGRRFIVVKKHPGHCVGVPIYTHHGQGLLKPGCKPEQFGVVHDARNPAQRLWDEPEPGFKPVRVNMKANETLTETSRVNYFMPTTIQYNFYVEFIGEVVKEDFKIVKKAYKKGT